MDPASGMQIGELSRRVGMSTHALRAWEKRYGLLRPTRTTGGYRIYSSADERRVLGVLALRDAGVPTAEAVLRVLSAQRAATLPASPAPGEAGTSGEVPAVFLALFARAVHAFDEAVAQAALDDLVASAGIEAAITDGILPALHRIGVDWESGEVTIGHEHFATQLVRRRLSSYSLTWGVGTGPVAVLGCPPGELHDITLLCFGVLLGRRGWRIRYLGADTPVSEIARAARATGASAVIVAATRDQVFAQAQVALGELAATYSTYLAGRGVDADLLTRTGAQSLPADLRAAAEQITETVAALC
ncbi:MAG: MerR family transcriptional regulator [Tetrasphaera sp.]|nr:MerR family transcriptional regulator [Tetrasphaera sp.]